jgi:Zn-dependent protease
MNRSNIALGKILGIPIALDYSWFLVFALITWTLAAGYYPAEFPGWAPGTYWLLGAVTAVLLFASVVLHELGHSTVARRFGIRVRRITLFIFGGIAQIDAEPPTPRAEFLIAVAGPAVSLVLALLFGLLRFPVAAVLPLLAGCGSHSSAGSWRARPSVRSSSRRRRAFWPGTVCRMR